MDPISVPSTGPNLGFGSYLAIEQISEGLKDQKEESKTPQIRKLLTDKQLQHIYIYHVSQERPWSLSRTARKFGVERRYISTHIPSNTYLQDI